VRDIVLLGVACDLLLVWRLDERAVRLILGRWWMHDCSMVNMPTDDGGNLE
jgi:hypothetical protein